MQTGRISAGAEARRGPAICASPLVDHDAAGRVSVTGTTSTNNHDSEDETKPSGAARLEPSPDEPSLPPKRFRFLKALGWLLAWLNLLPDVEMAQAFKHIHAWPLAFRDPRLEGTFEERLGIQMRPTYTVIVATAMLANLVFIYVDFQRYRIIVNGGSNPVVTLQNPIYFLIGCIGARIFGTLIGLAQIAWDWKSKTADATKNTVRLFFLAFAFLVWAGLLDAFYNMFVDDKSSYPITAMPPYVVLAWAMISLSGARVRHSLYVVIACLVLLLGSMVPLIMELGFWSSGAGGTIFSYAMLFLQSFILSYDRERRKRIRFIELIGLVPPSLRHRQTLITAERGIEAPNHISSFSESAAIISWQKQKNLSVAYARRQSRIALGEEVDLQRPSEATNPSAQGQRPIIRKTGLSTQRGNASRRLSWVARAQLVLGGDIAKLEIHSESGSTTDTSDGFSLKTSQSEPKVAPGSDADTVTNPMTANQPFVGDLPAISEEEYRIDSTPLREGPFSRADAAADRRGEFSQPLLKAQSEPISEVKIPVVSWKRRHWTTFMRMFYLKILCMYDSKEEERSYQSDYFDSFSSSLPVGTLVYALTNFLFCVGNYLNYPVLQDPSSLPLWMVTLVIHVITPIVAGGIFLVLRSRYKNTSIDKFKWICWIASLQFVFLSASIVAFQWAHQECINLFGSERSLNILAFRNRSFETMIFGPEFLRSPYVATFGINVLGAIGILITTAIMGELDNSIPIYAMTFLIISLGLSREMEFENREFYEGIGL